MTMTQAQAKQIIQKQMDEILKFKLRNDPRYPNPTDFYDKILPDFLYEQRHLKFYDVKFDLWCSAIHHVDTTVLTDLIRSNFKVWPFTDHRHIVITVVKRNKVGKSKLRRKIKFLRRKKQFSSRFKG